MLLLVSFLSFMVSFVNLAPAPCSPKPGLPAAKVLRHLRQKYVFVKKTTPTSSFNGSLPPPRKTRSDSIPGSHYCPWVWDVDNDFARVPPRLAKAVCPRCTHVCRPVNYDHTVLISKCDKTTGEKVWKWKKQNLAIAFVYKPYN